MMAEIIILKEFADKNGWIHNDNAEFDHECGIYLEELERLGKVEWSDKLFRNKEIDKDIIFLMIQLLTERHEFYRLENDDNGFYLSIIDRSQRDIYPRVWADNSRDGSVVIAQSKEAFLNDNFLSSKDWSARFFGENIIELSIKVYDYFN